MPSFLDIVCHIKDGLNQCLPKQNLEAISWLLPKSRRGSSRKHFHELQGPVGDDLIPLASVDDHDQQSLWATLPMEVLHDVIMRLENIDPVWPTRNHVLTCALVCKSWMAMCKELVKTSSEIRAQWLSLLSKYETTEKFFKQPGPRDSIVSCRLYCDKPKSNFHLLVLGHDNRFILSAKRERRTMCTDHVIYMHAIGDDILGPSSTYMGMLSSNFLGTEFDIFEAPEPPHRSGAMISSEVVPTVGSSRIAQVVYELNIRNPSRPRRYSQIAFAGIEDDGNGQEGQTRVAPLILRTLIPTWIDKLNFYQWKGTIYSENCFQLTASPSQSQQPAAPPLLDHHNISELYKTKHFAGLRREFFEMEYSYPFSTFLAFAICLSKFGTTEVGF